MKNLITLSLALSILLLVSSVTSAQISVEPDDFAEGTDISNAVTGVTLSAVGSGWGGVTGPEVYAINSATQPLEPFTASTGSLVFGHTGDFPHLWMDPETIQLRADFAVPAISVSLDFIGNNSSDYGELKAYDSGDTLIDSASTGQLTLSSVETLTVNGPGIAYILAGGLDDLSSLGLDNMLVVTCYPDLPDPELICNGWEDYVGSDGEDYTRYYLSVANWPEFPDELFEAAPDLPPCGDNPDASRTWVDIYKEDTTRIYGFCALDEAEDLTGIWFALPRGTPPECVYITLTDRRCDLVYTSNVVCPQWVDETGWAAGPRYVEKGNWAMYYEYIGEDTVDLRADGGDGVGVQAGTVHFSAVSGDQVTITITLNEGWRFVDQDENVKIQDYDSPPTKKAIPGKFEHKGYATGSSFEIVVPANNYYGVHANLEWLDCVE